MSDVIKLCMQEYSKETGLHYFIVVTNLCIMGIPWPWDCGLGLSFDSVWPWPWSVGLECSGFVNITGLHHTLA